MKTADSQNLRRAACRALGALAMLIFAHASPAEAAGLGAVTYAGSGCPGESASVTLSPDASAVSILFDRYLVEVAAKKEHGEKSCRLTIPVTPPAGYWLKSIRIDYRGFVSLPAKSRAELKLSYELPDAPMPNGAKLKRVKGLKFKGAVDSDFVEQDGELSLKKSKQKCGEPFRILADSQLLIDNRADDQAMIALDSTDGQIPVEFELAWEPCKRPR